MSPELITAATPVAKQLLDLIETDAGGRNLSSVNCYFCNRPSLAHFKRDVRDRDGLGNYRMDQYKFRGATMPVCTCCVRSISHSAHCRGIKDFRKHSDARDLEVLDELFLAEWISKALTTGKFRATAHLDH